MDLLVLSNPSGDKERQVRIQRGTELKGLVLNAFILLGDEPMGSHPKNEAGESS